MGGGGYTEKAITNGDELGHIRKIFGGGGGCRWVQKLSCLCACFCLRDGLRNWNCVRDIAHTKKNLLYIFVESTFPQRVRVHPRNVSWFGSVGGEVGWELLDWGCKDKPTSRVGGCCNAKVREIRRSWSRVGDDSMWVETVRRRRPGARRPFLLILKKKKVKREKRTLFVSWATGDFVSYDVEEKRQFDYCWVELTSKEAVSYTFSL